MIETIHRDIGSMKVDLRLRFLKGLGVSHLRSKKSASDFKFLRATELQGYPYLSWFFSYLFTDFRGVGPVLKRHVPNYSEDAVKQIIQRHLNSTMLKHWGLRLTKESAVSSNSLETVVVEYFKKSVPLFTPQDFSQYPTQFRATVAAYVEKQKKFGNSISLLPWSLPPQFGNDDLLITDFGVVFKNNDSATPQLALYDDSEIVNSIVEAKGL